MVETMRKQPQWAVLDNLNVVFCATSSLWPFTLQGIKNITFFLVCFFGNKKKQTNQTKKNKKIKK